MGVKNIIGDLNINGDLNVIGTITQNGAPISGGGEPGTFDFTSCSWTSLSFSLFQDCGGFEDAAVIFPSTLTSIGTNIFTGSKGNWKAFFNSIPTVSSSSYLPSDSANFTVKYYFPNDRDDVLSANNWSSHSSQIYLYITGVNSGVALQPYGIDSGKAITWYNETGNVVVTSSGTDNIYYGKVIGATREVYYLTEQLTDAGVTITGGYGPSNPFIPVGATITITPVQTDPTKDILVTFSVNGISYKNAGTATITVNADIIIEIAYSDVAIDSVLNNNTWSVIRSVCEDGQAANYWNVGDTKTDVGTDGYTRTFRIVDMSGLYGKHVVFEQVGLDGTDGTGTTGVAWDAGNDNDYVTSDMNITVLPSVITRYSSSLQNALTNTTVKVAENGNSATIVDVMNKLFLEASKEVGDTTYSRAEENSSLTTYAYYVSHSTASDRIKYNSNNTAKDWWLRSPRSGSIDICCLVDDYGGLSRSDANNISCCFAPCFSF